MIDYSLIAQSQTHYEKCGFKRIESPWTVTKSVIDITLPEGAKSFQLIHDDGKCLVGSGEQSFLYLFLKGFLPKGKYQTTTPCFRGDSFDFTHTKYFIKNELIITDDVDIHSLTRIGLNCLDYFSNIGFDEVRFLTISATGFDIEAIIDGKPYELGSYGIRQCEFLTWIYGTGLAEPRTSSLLALQNRGK